ncbi:hypothetical protein LSCM1_07519 [Leishmania martiniquensis]|uniref:Uncharacterized protein n=1 Tax=Leishmania martiniquensis TaxID=1580590 RepID=A0A836KWH6_9TRYP|nr:hypothetical protein LSCM1_07519 [Leishmania martiniquensis]
MMNESASAQESGGTDRERVLEKMLQDEIARRYVAESTAEGLRRQLKLQVREGTSPQQAVDFQNESVCETSRLDAGTDCSLVGEIEHRENDDASLQAENKRLRQYIRRQNALIDILRRQKVLLEASAAIAISERDFSRHLELHRV